MCSCGNLLLLIVDCTYRSLGPWIHIVRSCVLHLSASMVICKDAGGAEPAATLHTITMTAFSVLVLIYKLQACYDFT
jgi:hypothetical protein